RPAAVRRIFLWRRARCHADVGWKILGRRDVAARFRRAARSRCLAFRARRAAGGSSSDAPGSDWRRPMKDHDRKILRILQEDNYVTIDAIAAKVGLSNAAVQRHIKRLRSSGVIRNDVSVIDQEKVGLPLTFLVSVTLERERLDLLDNFKRDMRRTP